MLQLKKKTKQNKPKNLMLQPDPAQPSTCIYMYVFNDANLLKLINKQGQLNPFVDRPWDIYGLETQDFCFH